MPAVHAALVWAFIAWGLTLFLYSPAFWLPWMGGAESPSRIDDFIRLCQNPFARDLHEPVLAYRITTPMLAWLLGLRGFSGIILQYAAVIGTLALVFLAMSRRTDRTTAVWTTLGVAVSYTIIWTNTAPGVPDAVTHMAVAILLFSRNPFLTAVMTVMGILNDERFVLAIPFILCWHGNRDSLIALVLSSSRQGLGFLAGLAIAVCIRWAMSAGWMGPGIELPAVYESIAGIGERPALRPHLGWLNYFANIIMAYRELWLVFILAALSKTNLMTRVVPAVALVLVIISSSVVADVSRSIGFAFPAFLLAVQDLYKWRPERRKLLSWLVVCCIITPGFHIQGEPGVTNVQVHYPLPVSLWRAWTGKDVLSAIKNGLQD